MHRIKKYTKSTWLFLPLFLLLIILFGVFAAMLQQALHYDLSCDWSGGGVYPVAVEGEYSEEGGEWKPLSKETEFDYRELRDIAVRGHFTRDIPEGEKIFFNICQLWVTMRINGEEAFSFGPQEGDGNPAQSIGNLWYTFVSPGITAEDKVELHFGNLYRNAYFIQFDNLLWHMYTGSERALVFEAVHKDIGLLAVGTIFLVLTLFLFIAGILLVLLHIHGSLQLVWLGLCTLSSAVWFATLAPALSLFLPYPVLLNTLYSCSIQGIVVFLILFVNGNLTGWRKKTMYGALGVLLAAMLVGAVFQMKGIQDWFGNIDSFSMLDIAVALVLIFCLSYEVRVLKKRSLITSLQALLPLGVLGILEILNGFAQWLEAGIFFGMGLIFFAVLEGLFILLRIRRSMENEKRALELEKELSQSRISIMLSQIQPHFLYNSLVGIKQLCDTDPQRASDALEHFSYYLRGNLDSLSNTGLIPFEKELDHIEDYLYLEKMRYGERLRIRWEIGYQDFMLPPLTLQPIVENAVRYGITQKKAGGSLTIRSGQADGSVVITVVDDGVGFDISEKKEDGRTHIGLENVRDRLDAMCGGRLEVKSEIGTGTEIKLILPQRRNRVNENYSG